MIRERRGRRGEQEEENDGWERLSEGGGGRKS